MKLYFLFLAGMIFTNNLESAVAKKTTAVPQKKIVLSAKPKKKTKITFKRNKNILGYLRQMPNKVMKNGTDKTSGSLTNSEGQKLPVIVSNSKPTNGFYLGSFYDFDSHQQKYVSIKA